MLQYVLAFDRPRVLSLVYELPEHRKAHSFSIQTQLLLPSSPNSAEEAFAKMFLHMTGAKRLTLHARSQNVFHSLAQCRSLSMVTDQDPYWQKLKPWSNVTTEEFKTYRWQVRFTTLQISHLLPNSCNTACKHCARCSEVEPFLV
jgi:hypothetical protein